MFSYTFKYNAHKHSTASFFHSRKNLEFYFNDDMRIDARVQNLATKLTFTYDTLAIDATKTRLGAFVLLRLYYCNSLFYGSQTNFKEFKIQRKD